MKRNMSIDIGKPRYQKLPKNSKAHWYAFLMNKDKENKFSTYVEINKEEIEVFLKKKYKITPKGQIMTES